MRKIFLSLVATVLASTVAVAAEGASSAAPPVAEGSVPSGYVWLSGGVIALGIGYSWGHGTLYYSKDQKQYKFKLSGVSVADVVQRLALLVGRPDLLEAGALEAPPDEPPLLVADVGRLREEVGWRPSRSRWPSPPSCPNRPGSTFPR